MCAYVINRWPYLLLHLFHASSAPLSNGVCVCVRGALCVNSTIFALAYNFFVGSPHRKKERVSSLTPIIHTALIRMHAHAQNTTHTHVVTHQRRRPQAHESIGDFAIENAEQKFRWSRHHHPFGFATNCSHFSQRPQHLLVRCG